MKFVRDRFINQINGAIANVYVPHAEDNLPDTGTPFTGCEIDGSVRYLRTDILRMMQTFNREAERRCQLRQHCVHFALACATSNPYTHHQFDLESVIADRYTLFMRYKKDRFLEEPLVDAGQVVYTTPESPTTSGQFYSPTQEVHVMVRATSKYDLEGGLYLSKFGQSGPVALHEFSATSDFYPVAAAGLIIGLRLAGA